MHWMRAHNQIIRHKIAPVNINFDLKKMEIVQSNSSCKNQSQELKTVDTTVEEQGVIDETKEQKLQTLFKEPVGVSNLFIKHGILK